MKTLAVAAAFAAPLGGSIADLEVAPDGAAWTIGYDLERARTVRVPELSRPLPVPARPRAVRVAPDGAVETTPIGHGATAVTIGPDGRPWFMDPSGGLERVDAGGRRTEVRASGVSDERLTFDVVAGPAGEAWTTTQGAAPKLVRLQPGGAFSATPLPLPRCKDSFQSADLVRASDGAMWVNDDLDCDRLVRVAPTGAATVIAIPPRTVVTGLAPDAVGGVWFSALAPIGGHVTATGEVTLLPEDPDPEAEHWAVAQGPDGRPWFATESCELLRVSEQGAIERLPAPIPARRLAFAPDGRLWLASATRVVSAGTSAAGCDDRPPVLRLTTGGDIRRGVRISVDEATTLQQAHLILAPGGAHERSRFGPDRSATIRAARGGSFRLRIPTRWKLERGDEIFAYVTARDRDGNQAHSSETFRVRR